MKPQRFEIGQAVALTKIDGFIKFDKIHDPKDEIMHVRAYVWKPEYDSWYVKTYEYSDLIIEDILAPVITTHELESELSEIEITVAI